MPKLQIKSRGTPGRTVDRVLFWAASGSLLLLFAVVGGALLYRSRLVFQINYNEGWNSYFTARVLQGLPLYPARATQLVNNYPPLSFFLVAAVSALSGDVLAAGRAVAWCSLFGCAALIMLLVRRMGESWAGAGFGAVFFLALMATRYDLYVGMFDPQLPGQMLMLSGLLVLVSRPGRGAAVAAALLMVAGGFVKHSLIALPAAVTLWLAWTDRRRLVPWLLAGATGAVGGLLACRMAFGPEFVAGLLLPRDASPAEGLRKMVRWLLPIEVPLALAFLPWALGVPYARFAGLYLACALVSATLGAAPFATNYNMVFELAVAMSLGLGLLTGVATMPRGWAAAVVAGCVWLSAAQLATAETASWSRWSSLQRARQARAQASIAAIRARPGPALCGDLLLCFLAGKPFAFDPLNTGRAPGEDQVGLQQAIAAHRFAIIQVSPSVNFFLPATLDAIAAHYEPLPGLDDLATPRLSQ